MLESNYLRTGISFNKYRVPTTGDAAVNKTDPKPFLMELIGRDRR